MDIVLAEALRQEKSIHTTQAELGGNAPSPSTMSEIKDEPERIHSSISIFTSEEDEHNL